MNRPVTRIRAVVAGAMLAASFTVFGTSVAQADDPAPSAEPTAVASSEPTESASPVPDPRGSEVPSPGPTESASVASAAKPDEDTSSDEGEAATPEISVRAAKGVTAAAESNPVTAQVEGVARTFVDEDGTSRQVWPTAEGETATIEMTVSATKNLRGRQQLEVSWSGAHPTGGILADPNASASATNEYPFVLLQCRGVDTTKTVPAGQVRLSPKTCWTQTFGERTVESSSQWPAWRSDRYADSEDRYRWSRSFYDPIVGTPEGCPANPQQAIHWLPFTAADGKTYPGTPASATACGETAPEATRLDPIGIPSNTTYGITRPDGTGEARFTVWSDKENTSLGCSSSVACSLVAVPIVGVSCDEWGLGSGVDGTGLEAHDGRSDVSYSSRHAPRTSGSSPPIDEAQKRCRNSVDRYEPGASRTSDSTNPAVAGNLWWSASNWRNRISVPLEFAVSPDACAVASHDVPESFFGSIGFTEAAQSWQPKFCTTDSLFPFSHVQAPDSNARNLLATGGSQLALTTLRPSGGYERPVGRAPVAVTGFAIAFNGDDSERRPSTGINLNARLLAKLLTESYAVNADIRGFYSATGNANFRMSNQPANLLVDPEFQALNPDFSTPREAWSLGVGALAALQILGADADLMWALTSYIDADPEARAWLSGSPDPWGARVNPNYRNIKLPVQNWPYLDDWPKGNAQAESVLDAGDPCHVEGSPYLPLIHNQLGTLASVVENLQFARPAVKVCDGDGGVGSTYRTEPRQAVGSRFVIGLVPLSGAARYGLRTAALQTSSSDNSDEPFDDATGRVFVKPDDAGLKAASKLLVEDSDTNSWTFDYAAITTKAGEDAYPGLVPIYADVATKDVDADTANRLADFVCYAATDGQQPGASNGQLPAGYLPMTEANGLGAQRQQALAVAAAVREQKGATPELGATTTEAAACPESAPTTPGPTPTPTSDPETTTDSTDTTTSSTDDSSTGATTASEKSVAAPSVVAASPAVRTVGQTSAFGTIGPLMVLLLLLLTATGGVVLRWGQSAPELAAALGPVVRRGIESLRRRRE